MGPGRSLSSAESRETEGGLIWKWEEKMAGLAFLSPHTIYLSPMHRGTPSLLYTPFRSHIHKWPSQVFDVL